MDRVAPGPASALKGGTLPKLSTFLSQLKGEPFGEKTNFRIKDSQCRKTERGDRNLWGFSTSFLEMGPDSNLPEPDRIRF